MTTLTVAELTQNTLDGTGVFDVLMRANKVHLQAEFDKGRIKGSEYSTVYLGSLQSVMSTALQFITQRERIGLESQLLAQQILLAEIGLQKANIELQLLTASLAKVPAEIAQLTAQTAMVTQQKLNLIDELQTAAKQRDKLTQDIATAVLQGVQITAQTAMVGQQKANLVDELITSAKQRDKLTQDIANTAAQKLQIEAQTQTVTQQKTNLTLEALNIPIQGTVLVAQECKLRAEFDSTVSATLRSAAEITLLNQKTATERSQVTALGVDADSTVGRQKSLYLAQAEGFKRAAEQKAADVMVSAWNVQRTTDDTLNATFAGLDGSPVKRAVEKLLAGVQA